MSETLYRKYRPRNFSEIIGQHHIVQTLSNAIKNNRVGHAYLFTGPRGTGKTSVARIFAKALNCEKLKNVISCEKCQSCQLISSGRSLDIIEIDAASHTGVDNIRELRETVNLPPTSLKFKVYIIDEVHMLSTGAFNALLKTLEEPPAHVIFILATTEIHKVPSTIISRCQRFDFTRLPLNNIVEKLSLIAKKEKVSINKDSLEMIAISAEGGMRDAESLLAQVMALEDKKITRQEVEEILGTTTRQYVQTLAKMIMENNAHEAIEKINYLLNDGHDLKVFNRALINYLRQLMLIKISPELKSSFAYELTKEELENMTVQSKEADLLKIITAINLFLEAQSKIASFMLPQLPLEIAIIKTTQTFPTPRTQNIESIKPVLNEHKITPEIKEQRQIKKELKMKPVQTNSSNIDLDLVRHNWSRLMEEVKPYNHSLKALLSNCQVTNVNGNEVTLATSYSFYKDKINEINNRLTIEKVFSNIVRSKISIKAVVDKDIGRKTESKKTASQKNSSLVDSALEILGGKIVED